MLSFQIACKSRVSIHRDLSSSEMPTLSRSGDITTRTEYFFCEMSQLRVLQFALEVLVLVHLHLAAEWQLLNHSSEQVHFCSILFPFLYSFLKHLIEKFRDKPTKRINHW